MSRKLRKAATTLSRDLFCEEIHGSTGQVLNEGFLEAGALVIWTSDPLADDFPEECARDFLASTDGGRTWYRQRTWESVEDLMEHHS